MPLTVADSVKVSGLVPILMLTDTSGGAGDYRLRAETGKFYLELDNASSGSYVEVLGTDGSVVYAAKGISAGHDVATGQDFAFRVKRFHGNIGSSGTIIQALGTADVLGTTYGVIFMMTNNTSNPYTWQVYDWRSAASNGFYVEVTTNTTSGVGDSVTVTFDTSRYTNSSALWRMIVFYATA